MPKLAVDFFLLISPNALFDYCHCSRLAGALSLQSVIPPVKPSDEAGQQWGNLTDQKTQEGEEGGLGGAPRGHLPSPPPAWLLLLGVRRL